ncbi:energy transducer TonB [Gilvimarinus polysaccharolyticus]|uniref:energy transducer TonB n=1 Tax=Gilvimarinus polysaccharolyticus TaxID=863921 RepID=UPI00067320D2|nr:energy transducer TonB [Gilvimarinus polysaccharolyticus]
MASNVAVGIDTSVKSTERLSFTIFIAIIAHALIIFGLTFKLPDPDTLAPTLEITLANHKADLAPEDAEFLAQHNQEASGTEEQSRELTTEHRADFAAPDIREVNPAPMPAAATASNQQQTQVITSSANAERQRLRRLDEESLREEVERQGLPEEQPIITPEIASLQAKLDRQRQEYAKRPRIRRLTSVATRSSTGAEYLHNWSAKIEQVGNDNYPQQALRQRITGNLRLSVTLNPNGTIRDLSLLESSGVSLLDQAALQIVRLAAPFAPFPAEIRQDTDQLVIIRTWSFEIDGLTTRNLAH